jgi:hypothetical protein
LEGLTEVLSLLDPFVSEYRIGLTLLCHAVRAKQERRQHESQRRSPSHQPAAHVMCIRIDRSHPVYLTGSRPIDALALL